MDVEESRIRSTFVFAPELACSSWRSSGRAGDAIMKSSRNVAAARCRAANPTSPLEV
jgi:hypothetical protein